MKRVARCVACGHGPMSSLGTIPDGHLHRCHECGTLRLLRDEVTTDQIYEAYGSAYRGGLSLAKATRLYGLFRATVQSPKDDRRLLDVGCGDGTFLRRAREDGWNVCGVDGDPNAVAALARHGVRGVAGFVGGDLKLDESFDVVTLWDVIEHIPDIDKAMAWLAGAVLPQGTIVVLTPHAGSILDRVAHLERRLSRRRSQRLMHLCVNQYHLHRFTRRGLVRLFRRFGFSERIVRTTQLFSLRPERYLSGFAPGMPSWTRSNGLSRVLSVAAYALLRVLRVRNKILYCGVRKPGTETSDGNQ